MKSHTIEASFSSGIFINGQSEHVIGGDTLVRHGIQKEDVISITPGDSPVDLALSWEIRATIALFGYTNVILNGDEPNYIDF